jgi:DNA-binding LacI/PurR family transcriptional regulator
MSPTLHDVALVAGVSYRTVSNVINEHPHVRATTRDRVNAAIALVGYRPNYAARMLRLGRTDIIRLALPELDQPHFSGFASRVIEEANAQGLVVLTEQTHDSRPGEFASLAATGRLATDGLLIYPALIEPGDLNRILEHASIVLLGQNLVDDRVDQVTLRDVEGAEAATEHLLMLGHRHIAVIGADAPLHPGASVLRLEGYRNALARHGLDFDPTLVASVDSWRRRDGAEGVRRLLESGAGFSAVFAFNDTLALGVSYELQAQGRKVPADVSVVGFDNIDDAQFASPPLTTVDPGWGELARIAVETLVERMAHPDAPTRLLQSDARLVERESTARVPV